MSNTLRMLEENKIRIALKIAHLVVYIYLNQQQYKDVLNHIGEEYDKIKKKLNETLENMEVKTLEEMRKELGLEEGWKEKM